MGRKTLVEQRARAFERRIERLVNGTARTVSFNSVEHLEKLMTWIRPDPLAIDGRQYRRRKRGHR